MSLCEGKEVLAWKIRGVGGGRLGWVEIIEAGYISINIATSAILWQRPIGRGCYGQHIIADAWLSDIRGVDVVLLTSWVCADIGETLHATWDPRPENSHLWSYRSPIGPSCGQNDPQQRNMLLLWASL